MWGATLYHAADLPMRNIQKEMYNVFTPFRTKVEERCSVRNLLPTLEPNAVPLAQIDADFDATPTFETLPWASGPAWEKRRDPIAVFLVFAACASF